MLKMAHMGRPKNIKELKCFAWLRAPKSPHKYLDLVMFYKKDLSSVVLSKESLPNNHFRLTMILKT